MSLEDGSRPFALVAGASRRRGSAPPSRWPSLGRLRRSDHVLAPLRRRMPGEAIPLTPSGSAARWKGEAPSRRGRGRPRARRKRLRLSSTRPSSGQANHRARAVHAGPSTATSRVRRSSRVRPSLRRDARASSGRSTRAGPALPWPPGSSLIVALTAAACRHPGVRGEQGALLRIVVAAAKDVLARTGAAAPPNVVGPGAADTGCMTADPVAIGRRQPPGPDRPAGGWRQPRDRSGARRRSAGSTAALAKQRRS